MSAHVLTLNQQKASLSGKKNKKKVIKNVLGLPSTLEVKPHVVGTEEADNLAKIVERLLSDARLQTQKSYKFKKKELTPEELNQREKASKVRSQLSLGVNGLNRNIQQGLISAALVESDIQPKFLIHHINLYCTQKKIPLLHLPGLRTITKNSLGFSCIALGFKKDSAHFFEVISEIKSLLKTQTSALEENEESDNNDSSDSEILESVVEKKSEPVEKPFSYLYRSSVNERVFVPENSDGKLPAKSDMEFISIGADDEDKIVEPVDSGISSNLLRKQKEQEELLSLENLNESESDEDEEVYKVPKRKKSKREWFIDTKGTKANYAKANIIKVPSNPVRVKGKNKQQKK